MYVSTTADVCYSICSLFTTAGVTGTDPVWTMEMLHPSGAQDLLRILITSVLFLLGCKTAAVKKVQASTSISDIDCCRLHLKLRWMSCFWEAKITLRFKGGQFSGSPANTGLTSSFSQYHNAIPTHLRIHETDSKRSHDMFYLALWSNGFTSFDCFLIAHKDAHTFTSSDNSTSVCGSTVIGSDASMSAVMCRCQHNTNTTQ